MKLMSDLFSTDYGLMSLGVIVFTIGMGAFFTRLFMNKMSDSAAAELAQEISQLPLQAGYDCGFDDPLP